MHAGAWLTIAASTQPGAYRLIACVKRGRRLTERSRTNDCRTAPGLLIIASRRTAGSGGPGGVGSGGAGGTDGSNGSGGANSPCLPTRHPEPRLDPTGLL